MATPVFEPSGLGIAEAEFLDAHPEFDPGGSFSDLRRAEYGRLDAEDQVYLDYTGGGLHAGEPARRPHRAAAHAGARQPALEQPDVAGDDRSSSMRAREAVHEFFHAPPEDYLCVFTTNASGALRLVGEAYRFAPGGTFGLTFDNHNSVNGIREFARRKGAAIVYIPVVPPELRLDRDAMTGAARRGRSGGAATCWHSRRSRTSPASSTRSTSSTRRTRPAGTSWWTSRRSSPTNRFDVGAGAPGLRDDLLLQDDRVPDGRRLPPGAPRAARRR